MQAAVTLGAPTHQGVYNDTMWTSWEHGQLPVQREGRVWRLHWPTKPAQDFESGRALMRAVHGGRDPHLTPERYFRTGRHGTASSEVEAAASTLDLFGETTAEPIPMGRVRRRLRVSRPPAPSKRRLSGVGALHLVLAPPPGPSVENGGLGIDLAVKHLDIRRLLFAGFGKRIIAMGYEPEDVLQDVYRGLLARNKGRCPWDTRKSSFGHYVHMVCSCILSNYHRSKSRVASREVLGARTYDDDGRGGWCDVAESRLPEVGPDQDYQRRHLDMVSDVEGELVRTIDEPGLALAVLPHMLEGRNRREISRKVGVREGLVGVAVEEVRGAVRSVMPGAAAQWSARS
jgi:DNA-directed RNA polymerase specialized sigma24 family protein